MTTTEPEDPFSPDNMIRTYEAAIERKQRDMIRATVGQRRRLRSEIQNLWILIDRERNRKAEQEATQG